MPNVTPEILLMFLANGLVVGTMYVMMALGLSIIFGMVGVINIAHGVFYALGAYFALTLRGTIGFGPALVISPIMVAVIGMAIEAGFMRRLYKGDPLLGLLFTFGLAMVIEQLIRVIWGPSGHSFDIPRALQGSIWVGHLVYSKYRFFILALAVGTVGALWLFLEKTRYGMIIRAGSRDPEMVRVLGIGIQRIFTLVFGLGVVLAAFAGILAGPLSEVQPSMGTAVIVAAFVVVVIGGLGSFWGVVVAGLLVGEIVTLSILFWPPMSEASMYLLMAIILLVRPRGLFGERWERFE